MRTRRVCRWTNVSSAVRSACGGLSAQTLIGITAIFPRFIGHRFFIFIIKYQAGKVKQIISFIEIFNFFPRFFVNFPIYLPCFIFFCKQFSKRKSRSERQLLLPLEGQTQVLVGQAGDAAPPGGAGEEAHLHEIRLVHILQGHGLLPYGRGQVSRPTGPPP